MKRITSTLFLTLVLLAGAASAQMMGGGTNGGNNGTNGGMNNGTNSGMNNGMNNGMNGGGMSVIVGTDGTAYTIRAANATSTQAATFDVVAVRPSGTIGWSASIDAGMAFLELSGNHLLVTTGPQGSGSGSGQTSMAGTSRLVALSTASGSVQWTLQLDGMAFGLEPFAGGTYVTVVKPAQSGNSGGMHGDGNGTASHGARTLVAVGTDGKVLWSVPLNK